MPRVRHANGRVNIQISLSMLTWGEAPNVQGLYIYDTHNNGWDGVVQINMLRRDEGEYGLLQIPCQAFARLCLSRNEDIVIARGAESWVNLMRQDARDPDRRVDEAHDLAGLRFETNFQGRLVWWAKLGDGTRQAILSLHPAEMDTLCREWLSLSEARRRLQDRHRLLPTSDLEDRRVVCACGWEERVPPYVANKPWGNEIERAILRNAATGLHNHHLLYDAEREISLDTSE